MRSLYVQTLQKAREAAYHPESYVGQENFMGTEEILALARQAEITSETRVLDLCCGVGGPGNHIARHCGSHHLGLDRDPQAVELARLGAQGLTAQYRVGDLLDSGLSDTFDVVMLLETILAFEDKRPLLAEVAARMRPGGHFVFTLEEGSPLTLAERAAMPESHTVWPIPLAEMENLLHQAGLDLEWSEDHTTGHARLANRLEAAFRSDSQSIATALGSTALTSLLESHRLWADWMEAGRIRKFALIATRRSDQKE